jgi:hypothetical protein
MKSVESQVKDFVGENDTRLEILGRILEYEQSGEPSRTFGDRADMCDWEPGSDVYMSPSYIGIFKHAPFIDVLFDSNSGTTLALSDYDGVRAAYNSIQSEPDEWSDEWLEQRLGGNKIDSLLADVEVSAKDRTEIESIVSDVDALDYWSEYVAPGLKHRSMGKKAVMVMLASPQDAHSNKGRVNILLYGPPGTGKSVIKNYLVDKFESESIDGPRVSKADITYNKQTDEFGQLPKAHQGILVVEESDEMDNKPLGAALTSLGEAGQVEIRDKTIPAKAQGVFLGNFETVDEAISQWSREAVNRFDFKVKFDRLSKDKKDQTLEWHYSYFRQPKPRDNEEMFMQYLKICRAHTPEIAELDKIQNYKAENIESISNIRQGLSIMNIAWIIARLNLDDVRLTHFKQAHDILAA